MIVIVRYETDNIEEIIQEQENLGNRLLSVKNEDGIATMTFLESAELSPPTLDGVDQELKETKEELSSTQVGLSEVYEQLLLLQEELNLLKETKNNG